MRVVQCALYMHKRLLLNVNGRNSRKHNAGDYARAPKPVTDKKQY